MSKLMIVEVPSYSCEFKGIREICEIVLCGECKHTDGSPPIADGRSWCERHGSFMHYCSDEHKERIRQGNLGKHGQQRKVICVDDGMLFGSYNEAGKHYGISPMTVKSCCEKKSKGKVKTFRYADGEREGE